MTRFAAWATCLALVTGLLFPLWGAAHFLQDDDPGCGPSGLVGHSVEQFESGLPPAGIDHCILCHTWRTLGNAAPGLARGVVGALASDVAAPASDVEMPEGSYTSSRSSRAPPAAPRRVLQIHA